MPTSTYELISSTVLGSSSSSVTIDSIPSNFRDLVVVFNGSTTATNRNMRIRINGDTGGNYFFTNLYGNGSTTSAYTTNGDSYYAPGFGLTELSTTPAAAVMHFLDYQATDKHKQILMRIGRADSSTFLSTARWASTSAITSINFSEVAGGSYAAGSSWYLYGIAA